jgi:CIC family chloride channel protein
VSAAVGNRVRFVLGLALVTVAAGAFAVAFRASLAAAYHALYGADNIVESIERLPRWLRLAAPTAAGAAAGTIACLRGARTQGVSNVMEAIALGRVQLSLRTTASRVASSWVAIAGGLSIGREGPLIEVGGALGAAVGRRVETSLDQTRVLIGAGTAAGFAAAYNTPFAASLFVLETIAGVAAPELLLPVMAATVGATGIVRATVGAGPIYGQRAFGLESYWELVSFAGLALAAAVIALLFKTVLGIFERWFDAHPVPQPYRATLGGLFVGVIAMWLPSVVGNGYEPLNGILNSGIALDAVAVLVIAKIIATSASVGSGVPGGVFTPMLLVGAALGAGWSRVASFGPASDPGSYALVGMAAATAASIHAPLTAAIMVFELSGDYLIVLPLILATVIATTTSKALGGESVYESELRKRGLGWEMTLEGRLLKDDVDSEIAQFNRRSGDRRG